MTNLAENDTHGQSWAMDIANRKFFRKAIAKSIQASLMEKLKNLNPLNSCTVHYKNNAQ